MFDLNDDKEFGGNSVFNGGNTGLVKNVTGSIERRPEGTNQPHYKLVVSDGAGTINAGFYYPEPHPQKNDEENAKTAKMHVGRVLHIAKAVMGDDYTFPEVNSAKEAYDTLFKLIHDNIDGKKFNVYATYGTKNRPSKYLGLRFFEFIEPAREESKLFPKAVDMMERLVEDSPEQSTDDWV